MFSTLGNKETGGEGGRERGRGRERGGRGRGEERGRDADLFYQPHPRFHHTLVNEGEGVDFWEFLRDFAERIFLVPTPPIGNLAVVSQLNYPHPPITILKVRSLESVPFSRYFHFCDIHVPSLSSS